jgi:hypothetical protein
MTNKMNMKDLSIANIVKETQKKLMTVQNPTQQPTSQGMSMNR